MKLEILEIAAIIILLSNIFSHVVIYFLLKRILKITLDDTLKKW